MLFNSGSWPVFSSSRFFGKYFLLLVLREHGVVGDMRDAWPNARVRKNVSLIRTYHGFKGTTCAPFEIS